VSSCRSFALFSRLGSVGQIYNGDEPHRFQLTLEPALRQTFPFSYPPSYLFPIWPLSFLSYGAAYLVWDGVTLALFLWSVFGTRVRAMLFWFVLPAATTMITLIQGQNGLLTSALVVGGTRVMRAQPVLGGVLLGLATIKPRLGILVQLALLAAGYWRTLADACVTAISLVIASGAICGWALWVEWVDGLSSHAAYLDVSVGNYLKPGIMANLVLFGVAAPAAHAIQGCVGLVVAAIVFLCFWRGATDPSIAALQAGTFLAMPYVFRYDMPMLANAILLMARDRRGSGETVNVIEAVVLFLGLMAPAITTVTTRFFYVSGLSLPLLFGLAVWWRLRPLTDRRSRT